MEYRLLLQQQAILQEQYRIQCGAYDVAWMQNNRYVMMCLLILFGQGAGCSAIICLLIASQL